MEQTKIAFHFDPIYLSAEQILATKSIGKNAAYTKKYKQIRSSIQEIGIIEPLSVSAIKGKKQQFALLDGHMRFEILKEMEYTEIPCLISTDDENYTHNKQTNRLSTVQEHFMIRRAIEQGVDTERLAKTLNIDIKSIRTKMNLLNDICPEVIERFKNKDISPQVFAILKKMKPIRQLECTDMMLSMDNVTVLYAKALFQATDPSLLVNPPKKLYKNDPSAESIKKMENESANLHLQYKSIEQNYAQDTLNLVVAIGYLTKLTANPNIKDYLTKYHSEILSGFESLIKLNSIELN